MGHHNKAASMFVTGLIGFIVGMVAGALVNRMILRNVPVAQWRTNRDLKLKYGALNWLFGLAGILAALFIAGHA